MNMKISFTTVVLIISCFFLNGCDGTSTSMIHPTAVIIDTETPTPTTTPTPTPTVTPTLSLPVTLGTPIPREVVEIYQDRVSEITEVVRWGKGTILGIEVSEKSQRLLAYFSTGITVFDLRTFELIAEIPDTLNQVFSEYSISPDGELLAVSNVQNGDGSMRNTRVINIWSTNTGELIISLSENEITCGGRPVFSPDNRMLAFPSFCNGYPAHSKTILWNLETGEELINEAGAWYTAFSEDSHFFATAGSEDYSIKVWDVSNQNYLPLLHQFNPTKKGDELQVTFLPGNNQLVGMYNDTTYVWSIPDGELMQQFEGSGCYRADRPDQSRHLPAPNYFLRGGCQFISVWDLSTGNTIYSSSKSKYYPDVPDDGSRLLANYYANQVSYWNLSDLPSGKTISNIDLTDPFFSKDGKFIIDKLEKRTLVYNGNDGAFLYEFSGILPVILPEEKLVTVGINRLLIWNLSDGSLHSEIPIPNNGTTVYFAPESNMLIEEFDQGIKKIDLETLTHSLIEGVYLCYSQNGNRAVLAGEKGIEIIDLASGIVINMIDTYQRENWAYLSPDGSVVVTRFEKSIKIWQVSDGQLLIQLPNFRDIEEIFITDDNHYLILNALYLGNEYEYYHEMSIWELPQGRLVAKSETKMGDESENESDELNCELYPITLSADSKYVVYILRSSDNTGCDAMVMDIESGTVVSRLTIGYGHNWEHYGRMALSNNAELLATAFLKNEIKLWEVATGKLLRTWSPAVTERFSVGLNMPNVIPVFSPDGCFLAFMENGIVRVTGITEE